MNEPTVDSSEGAATLLARARQASADQGELMRLMLAGTRGLDSWLIEHRIIPALRDRGLPTLRFTLRAESGQQSSAKLLPLPGGSAFACATDGSWSAFEAGEARHEIGHIGHRYAPGDRWLGSFAAVLEQADGIERPLGPSEVAQVWREATGAQPIGYAKGAIDYLEAIGSGVLDKAFGMKGRLGL